LNLLDALIGDRGNERLRGTDTGNRKLGVDFEERYQHERAFGGARVGNRQIGIVDALFAV